VKKIFSAILTGPHDYQHFKEKADKGIQLFFCLLGQLKCALIKLFLFNFLYGKINQITMKVDSHDISFSTIDKYSKLWFFPRYSKKRLHEPILTRLLIDSLSQGQTFVDVGANLGYFTCLIGKLFPANQIFSFEVDPQAFTLLEKNIKLNNLDNIKAYNCGISNKEGFVKIPKNSTPDPRLSIIVNDADANDGLAVRSVDLDSFFLNEECRPDVIKIDVEGAELLVLQGMRSLLEKENLTIFLELHGNILSNFGTNSKEVISLLQSLNYDIYEIKGFRKNNFNEKIELIELGSSNLIQRNIMCYAIKHDSQPKFDHLKIGG